MQNSDLKIEVLPVDVLKMDDRNARKHEKKDIDTTASSIKKYGFNDPIGIWGKDNLIVEGHGRLLACKQLGITEVPCIRLDHLTEQERREYAIMHNKTAEISMWDYDILKQEIEELKFDDIPEIDWQLPEMGVELEPETIQEDDFNEEPPEEPICQKGDIWQLGDHRLMCGDSTNGADVPLLMNGDKADMVFTDPPYGMKKENEGVLNDNLNFNDLLEFNKKWIPLSFEYTKDNGSWYCWGIDESLMDIYSNILKPMIKENKITFRNLITWDKGHGQGQLSQDYRMYAIADEKCLFVMCGVQGFNNNSDNYYEEWEPIRSYLFNEWRKISDKNDWSKYLGNCMGKHYFTKSQWMLPTKEQYNKMQEIGEEHGAFKKQYEEIKKQYEEIKKQYYSTRAYFDNTHDNMNNVWHFERTSNEERALAGGHATPKPIALCSRTIKSSSKAGEKVLDLFGGSGSTLIACEQLHRKCYMMELDNKYCDVIINRWQTLTGKKAVKL